VEGTDFLSLIAGVRPCSCPVPLVLAAVLATVTGARVAPMAPSHRDAEGALATVTMTWILSGRGNVAAGVCVVVLGEVAGMPTPLPTLVRFGEPVRTIPEAGRPARLQTE
jgi:hypothetical protein